MKSTNIKDDLAKTDPIHSINSWLERCRDARNGHYKRAETLFHRSQSLGYILIYTTVFVTAFSFFTLDTTTTILWGITKQHIVVLMGCISAVISGIVTQSRYGERAEIHRSSGARYANLARTIEVLQLKINTGIISNDDIASESNDIITEWNSLSKDSLLTPHNNKKSNPIIQIAIALIFSALFFIVATHAQTNQIINYCTQQHTNKA